MLLNAMLTGTLCFILQVLTVMLIEESAKAGFRKLKKSKAIRRRISVLWFCLYIKWRSRK
ncbi:hypothetical protein [Trichocoleus sp. ST-U2]|uniref:hypothetical protein n=2 Tax=Cyanophyceae TaxID=3028117 RepID=UPI0032997C63